MTKALKTAIANSIQATGERALVFAHLSHIYTDGANIYVTYLFRRSTDPEETLGRWHGMKTAASQALVRLGGTISHQHGVGQDHISYLEADSETESALAAYGEPFGPHDEGLTPTVYHCPNSAWEHCSGSGGLLMDTALWNRAHLASLLQDGWAIEQVEAQGGNWMHEHRPDLVSVGLVPGLFETVKLVSHFQPRQVSGLGALDPRDAEAIRAAMPANWEEGLL